MKSFLPLTLLISFISMFLVIHVCSAQSTIEYLDKRGNPVKEKRATFLKEKVQVNDTLWETNIYRVYGPRISSTQYKDEKEMIPNGRYFSYDETGLCDTMGSYVNGLREGAWSIRAPNPLLTQRLTYVKGVVTNKKDSTLLHMERPAKNVKNDSSHAFTHLEMESTFPGGPAGWLQFMNQNLHYPDRAVNHTIQGTAVLSFMIDELGHIQQRSICIIHSVEYSIDVESLKLIHHSPDWIPAMQNGRHTKSYKKQPIVFRLTR